MRRRWLIVVLVLLGAGLAGFLALIGATNVVLSNGWLKKQINANPEKTLVDYSGFSCRWPGRITLRGISVRSRDSNVEWLATIDEAAIEVDLPALIQKRLHVKTLNGAGLSFRLRERLEPREAANAATLARTRSYPPIAGFADPPMTSPSAQAEMPPAKAGAWSVHIGRLSLSGVKEIWVDDFRYRGSGTLNGGFFLTPGIVAQVYPSRLTLDSGTLELGPKVLATPFRGAVTCTLPHFDVPKYFGNEIWKIMTGTAALEGVTPDLAFLGAVVNGPGAPRFETGTGPLALRLALADGAGSARVDFSFEKTRIRLAHARLAGSIGGALVADRLDFRNGKADLGGSFLDLRDIRAEGAGVDADRAWWGRFDVASAGFDMSRSILQSRLRAHCRDARPLFALFEIELPGWARGLLRLDGLRAQADVRLADQALDLAGLHAAGGAFKIDGRYRKTGRKKDGAFLVQTSLLDLGVKVDAAGVGLKLLGAKKWFAENGGRLGEAAPASAVARKPPAPSATVRPASTSRSDKTRSSSRAGSREDSSPRETARASRTRG